MDCEVRRSWGQRRVSARQQAGQAGKLRIRASCPDERRPRLQFRKFPKMNTAAHRRA